MDNNIFFKYNSKIEPENGSILVSEPHLPDSNFDRTVILLCKHDDEGSFGFVLNKKSNTTLGELLEEGKGIDSSVFIGGPVEQNTLHFLHRDDTLENSEPVANKLFWGGNFEMILNWLKDKVVDTNEVRFFLGYSGWSSGQLLEEIKQNSWMVFKPKNYDFVFDASSEDLWKSVLEEMGGRYSMYSKYPIDPRLN